MASLVLYNYFRSSASYRTRIALHHKGLNFEYKPVHLLNNGGEQHSGEYKKLNPQAEVPTLVHDGKIISQSVAIIEYLDEVFPQHPLYPKDSFKKAKVRQFCEIINSFIQPLGNLKVIQYLENVHQYNQAKKEDWVSFWSTAGFTSLEKILETENGKYCFGDQITAADCFLIPQVFTAKRYNVKLDAFPHCRRVVDNCNELEAFKKAHPLRQIDTPAENRIP
jgi:maleylacetoacetate isomerase/maleylpyruvate isomerase